MATLRPEQLRGGTAGNIYVDDGTRMKTVAVSGDFTLSSAGVGTLASVITPASVGAADKTLTQTVNAKGLTTAIAAISIAIAASQITSGQLSSARGGTGADLSAAAQGAVPYFASTGVMAALAAGASGFVLTAQGAGANPVWAAPATAGTVTSVAMTVPSILSVAGSPITSSGTLAVTLATQAANLMFAGPASGAAATPTFRACVPLDLAASPLANKLLYATSSSAMAWSGAITDTHVPSFQSGVPAGDAGFTYGGQAHATALINLTPTNTGSRALRVVLPASSANTWLAVSDSDGNTVISSAVSVAGANTFIIVTPSAAAAGSSNQAQLNMGIYPYQTTGNAMAVWQAQTRQGTGTAATCGQIGFFAAESQASGAIGVDILVRTCSVGASTVTTRQKFTANGNSVMNATGSALATTATNGFLYMPCGAGPPTGTPTAYTGSVAFYYDTTNNRIYVYNGAWRLIAVV